MARSIVDRRGRGAGMIAVLPVGGRNTFQLCWRAFLAQNAACAIIGKSPTAYQHDSWVATQKTERTIVA